MRRILVMVGLVALGAVLLAPAVLAQDGSVVADTPTADTLRTAAGIAIVVALITNVLRTVVPPAAFDKWGPTIAVVVGIILGVVGLLVASGNHDGNAFVTAILAGAFGGFMSQNVNTVLARATRAG